MSMPSSRLLVATTQGSRPRLRSSSISARCSLETEPWWALAMTWSRAVGLTRLRHHLRRRPGGRAVEPSSRRRAVGGDLVEPRGQPLGEPARVGEDDRRAVLLDQVDDPLLDVRPDALGALRVVAVLVVLAAGAVMSSTGTTTLRSHSFSDGGATISTGARAAEEAGDLVERAHGRATARSAGRAGRAARRGAPG